MQIGTMPSMSGMQAGGQGRFNKADLDGSGGISKDEFSSMHTAMQEKMAASGVEMPGMDQAKIDEIFSSADIDGNSELSNDEMKALHEKMGPPPPPPQGGNISSLMSEEDGTDIETLLEMLKEGAENQEDSSTADQLIARIKELIYSSEGSESYTSDDLCGNLLSCVG